MSAAPRRPLTLEVCLVAILATALLLPGIWNYSLVDPWETHYGEVGRRMLEDHDWVHTQWENEGFRSKPVLTFWLMAGSMKALGVAPDGGYSGAMVDSGMTMLAIRLPFVLFAVAGLTLMWWALARLLSRRAAYLGLLAIGTAPLFSFIARQGITDMPMVACLMGAIAMLAMAREDDRAISPFAIVRLPGRVRVPIDARHVAFAAIGLLVGGQALYYLYYFARSPQLAAGIRFPAPGVVLALLMVALLAMTASLPYRAIGRPGPAPGVAWRLFGLERLTRTRQVSMLWFWALLGVSVLAKGPAALGIVGVVCFLYILILGRWRDLYEGQFELKRGLLLVVAISVPWHVAMYLKEGHGFYKEYVLTHVLNRAGAGVDNENGTFAYYLPQLGFGMMLWAALLPSALAAFVRAIRPDTREGRVRLLLGLWAFVTVAFFAVIQTKFHHYILPAVPPLALIVALWLDDVAGGRVRPSLILGALGIGIVLLVARDLVFEVELWIEMFVFRYDRPWPNAPPWEINVTDGPLALGLAAAAAIALLVTLGRRGPVGRAIGIGAVAASALAITLWAQHVYMPEAGTHWGMRQTVRTYYEQRTIYGERLVYFGDRQLYDAWSGVTPGADGTARWRFETFLPDALQVDQPMTVRIQVNRPEPGQQTKNLRDLRLHGRVVALGDHSVELAIPAAELTKLAPALAAGKTAKLAPVRPVRAVDADRLIAAQIYWRGEVFWSGNEIAGWLPEMKTDWGLGDPDNKKFTAYLSDPNIAPPGRRYFVISEQSRPGGLRGALPTERAKSTWKQIDQTSNKFTLSVFTL